MKKFSWNNWSLAVKLILTIILALTLTVAGITLLSARNQQTAFQAELEQQARLVLNALSIAVTNPLLTEDVGSMQDVMEELGGQKLVVYGRVYDKDGRVVADAFDPSALLHVEPNPTGQSLMKSDGVVLEWRPDMLVASQVVLVGRQRAGVVSVGLSTARLSASLAAMRLQGLGAAVAAALVGVLLALLFSRSITGPLQEMLAATQRIAAGDLSQFIPIRTGDELAALAKAFNQMVVQLRTTLTGLENRTRALATSAEVSRRLSTILDQAQLLSEVVEQARSAFNYYHVHIYLFDEAHEHLVLVSGTGEVGRILFARGHKLPQGQGLVGRAAGTNAPVVVPDVAQDPAWLPNPLLPETKSEVAVPIAIGERVLGVLDVQHDVSGGLTQADADLLQSIANQVAVALQNARLYAQAQRQARQEALVNAIGQEIQKAGSVEGVLQIAARELGRSLGAQLTSVQLTVSKAGNGHGGDTGSSGNSPAGA